MKTRNLQRHLNRTHACVFSEWPRKLDDEPRCRVVAEQAAVERSRSAEIKCCICGLIVRRVRDLKKHMRKEHWAPRPPARLRRANVPSSLGRISMLQIGETRAAKSRSGKKRKARSSSVRTVQGGLPDSNRSKH